MDAIHKLKILVMFLSLATFMVMVILNAGNATGIFKGLFRTTPGNISATYNTDFTPAGWTFLIWNVIYAWHLAWLLYALSGICRRNELACVYIKPDLLPIPFYVVWILNNGLNVGWLFLWDREYLLPALVFLAALTFTTCASLFISHQALSMHSSWFVKGHKAELWLIRILVQNGLALYATWTTIATLLNFAVVVIYKWNASNETATTASLSILALGLVIWFYLENFFLDKHVRYNLTIYPVVIIALTGSTCKNFSFSSPTTNGIFIGSAERSMFLPFSLPTAMYQWLKLISRLTPPLQPFQYVFPFAVKGAGASKPENTQQDLAELVCQKYEGTGDSRPDGYGHQECEVVLLAMTCLIFAVRLGLVIWRHCKRPLEASETQDPSSTVA